jgi:hypothetical protein
MPKLVNVQLNNINFSTCILITNLKAFSQMIIFQDKDLDILWIANNNLTSPIIVSNVA